MMVIKIAALLCAFTLSPLALVAADEPTKVAENVAPEPPKLQLANVEGFTVVGDEILHDFGRVNALDDKQRLEDMEEEDRRNFLVDPRPLAGLKHVFTLKNTTSQLIVIEDLKSDSMPLEAEILRGRKRGSMPRRVEPGETVDIRLAYDFYMASAGKTSAKLAVMARGSKAPVATLVMQGIVENGIDFSIDGIDFGKVKLGTTPYQDVVLKMDRRIPDKMLSAPIHFETANPGISISSLPAKQSVMGIEIDKNTILFPVGSESLPEDLNITYRISLGKNMPLGKFSTKAKLWMPDLPLLIVFYGKEIKITGEVVK